MLTKEKVKGTKFEIWLEDMIKKQDFSNVLRNVEFHKKRYVFRQVDISYNIINEGKIYHAIVEAKFSSRYPISYVLRDGEQKKKSADYSKD